ncbi:MAG: hypothetical protein ACJ71Q_00955 [Terriglobales bacterium]
MRNTCAKWLLFALFVSPVLFFAPTRAYASADRPATFTKIDVDGALTTVASGINNDGYIVGWYCLQTPCNGAGTAANPATEANPRTRGFVRNPDGSFTFLDANDCTPTRTDCHHAIGTQPRYISPQGVVIGAYFTMENGATFTNPRFRGFAWFAGQFTYFDVPPDQVDTIYDNPADEVPHSIIPRAINANGVIVGCIHDKDQMGTMHGFRLQDGKFTRLAEGMTMNNGVNTQGDIVGLDPMNLTGYHLGSDLNVLERIYFPGTDETDAWGINAQGEIVGQAFTNSFNIGHAFLRNKQGAYNFIDPPGTCASNGCASNAFAVAENGSIVGNYRDSLASCSTKACVHGYLRERGND